MDNVRGGERDACIVRFRLVPIRGVSQWTISTGIADEHMGFRPNPNYPLSVIWRQRRFQCAGQIRSEFGN